MGMQQIVEREIEEYRQRYGDKEEEYRKDVGSELWKQQTFRQFFETIDHVLDELKIPIEEIKRLQDLIKGSRNDNDGRDPLDKLNELILPAYIRLREMGYNRYPDLVR